MTSQFANYVPIQGLIGAVTGIATAEESISESSQTIDPTTVPESLSESSQLISPTQNTESMSESPVVTIT